jgi:hypothetical protein
VAPDVAPDVEPVEPVDEPLPPVAPVDDPVPVVDVIPVVEPVVPALPVVTGLPVVPGIPLFEIATPDVSPDVEPVDEPAELVLFGFVEHADSATTPAIPTDALIHFMVIFALVAKKGERISCINGCTPPFEQANPCRVLFYVYGGESSTLDTVCESSTRRRGLVTSGK